MRVVMVSAEMHPYAVTGGLGSVVGSLSRALAGRGVETSVVMPMYEAGAAASQPGSTLAGTLPAGGGESFDLHEARDSDGPVRLLLVRCPARFARDGLYGPTPGEAYEDNADRFAFLCRAAASLLSSPFCDGTDVVHCHDWHAALVPAYLPGGPATVLTIHNLAYQGNFPVEDYPVTGLPGSLLVPGVLEFWGGFSFMKAGIVLSNAVTTVSPTYAREILTAEQGMGLDGVLRSRSTPPDGILNGIDYGEWDPAGDAEIASRFDAGRLSSRRLCVEDLREGLGLDPGSGSMLVGMVGRLTYQKGVDLLIDSLDRIAALPIQLAVLGSGESRLESALLGASARYPGRMAVRTAFDVTLARKIYAGSDCFLMPSLFEPCGISQMIAMRYGSVPIVRRTGGLADTVLEAGPGSGNGFLFDRPEPDDLVGAVERAVSWFSNRHAWTWMVRRAMAADNSWDRRVEDYLGLYRRVVGGV